MSGGGSATRDARTASRIQQDLFRRYAEVGVPIVSETQGRIRGELAAGEPGYIGAAYEGARGGAADAALEAELGLRRQLRGREGGALLQGLVGASAAGGRAFVEERSGVSAAQATNRIQQRNNLLRLLSGQGAQATNLSQGFGRLGLQGIGAQLQGGDPVYEAVLGLGSAGAAGYLNWLTNRPGQLPQTGNTVAGAFRGHPGLG